MEGTWIAVAALAVSGLFAWLNKRDTLRYDLELARLRTSNETQAAQITTLTTSHEQCRSDHAAAQGEINALRRELDDLKKKLI